MLIYLKVITVHHFVLLRQTGEDTLTFQCVDMHLLGAVHYVDYVTVQPSES